MTIARRWLAHVFDQEFPDSEEKIVHLWSDNPPASEAVTSARQGPDLSRKSGDLRRTDCPRRSRLFARIAILHAWLDRSRNRTIRSLQAGLQLLRKAIHHRGFKQVGVISWDPSDLAPAGCQLAPYQSGINRRTEPTEFVRVFSDEDNRFSRVTL